MGELSESDIAEAAREAGISPAELQQALARRDSGTPDTLASKGDPSATQVRIAAEPPRSVRHVREHIERELQCKGHQQGDDAAAIVDDSRGVIYRVNSEQDGAGGALVRVSVDDSPARARQTLVGLTLGAAVAMMTLGMLLVAGSSAAGITGAIAVVAAMFIRTSSRRDQSKRLAEASERVRGAAQLAEQTPVAALPEARR